MIVNIALHPVSEDTGTKGMYANRRFSRLCTIVAHKAGLPYVYYVCEHCYKDKYNSSLVAAQTIPAIVFDSPWNGIGKVPSSVIVNCLKQLETMEK